MTDNWVIWLIFGLLLAALIGFLVFSFFKDKRKNRKIAQKRLELKRAAIKTSKELAIRIYTLIEINNELVEKVNPGNSSLKMKDINFNSRQFLKRIYDSKAFKTIYIESQETDPNYAQYLKNLIDKKSNLWLKYCETEINYFKELHDELENDEKFDLLKNDAKKDILNLFNNQGDIIKNEFS